MEKTLVLIIDASSDTRSMYADYFVHHGYAVAEAAHGAEGVRRFHDLRPDLIVTELSEEPEWVHALQAMRWPEVGLETAMIACSTMIDSAWPAAPAGIDVDVALPKPTSPRTLLLEARELLARRASGMPAFAS